MAAVPPGVVIRIAGMASRLPARTREAILVRAAQMAIGQVRRRTRGGTSVEGGPFVPYSRRYAELRLAAGRRVTPVDLTLSGHMLGSLSIVRRSPRLVLVGFRGAAPQTRISVRSRPRTGRSGAPVTRAVTTGTTTVANTDKARWAQFGTTKAPARPFVGVTGPEYEQILADVARVLRLAG